MYPTSPRFRAAIVGSHRAVARARVLSSIQFGATPTGLSLPIRSGNVKLSSTTDIKGTLDLTIGSGDYYDSVGPFGAEIFVERGIAYGDGTEELVPLGYYRIESAEQENPPSGSVKVTGKDRIAQMRDVRLPYPYQYPAGLSHATLFNQLVNGYTDPTGFNGGPLLKSYGMYFSADVPIVFLGYDGSNAFLPAGVVEDDIYEHITDIVDSRGCVLRFDRLGQLVIDPRDREPDEPSVYTIEGGKTGTLISASRKVVREGVYNYVVARGSDPESATGYRIAYNADPNSKLRWDGPFGPVVRHYASPLLRTTEQALQAASSILKRYVGLPEGTAAATVPDPSLDVLDAISLRVGGQLVEHLIDELTIPVVGTEPLTIVTRTLNAIPNIDEDSGGGEEPGGGTGGGGEEPGGGGVDPGGPPAQTLGVGGVAAPAAGPDVVLKTTDTTAKLTIRASNKIYDGGGKTCGTIDARGDGLVIQNFRVRANAQYGILCEGIGNTIQNNDIKEVKPSGDGDLNAITSFGPGQKILLNTADNFVAEGVDLGNSHTDFYQTWTSTSHPLGANDLVIQGNRATGPANPSRDNSVPSIHQAVMVEAKNKGGNTGGSGTTDRVTICDNEFGDSWNQSIKLDGVNTARIMRNNFTGSSTKVMDIPSTTDVLYYSDNIKGAGYPSVGMTVTSGNGPASPVNLGGGGGGGGGTPGVSLIPAKFKDGVSFPWFIEPTSTQQVVPCTTSDFATKLAAAAPGQTLVLSDGTYAGSILTMSKSGTALKPIVVRPLNTGGVKFASGGGIKITGQYCLVKGLVKEFDDSGKTFSFEGAAKFSGFDGCTVGPLTLGTASPTAAKSLHYYAGGDASDCFFTFCESRNKSKPGNGFLVDGNFDTGKACSHILIDHADIHDYGTEAVNDFEAIRYGVSTMQTSKANGAIIRCVFTNIKSEPEIISIKVNDLLSWGHTVDKCIGTLSIRHGDGNSHKHCYSFGPATGTAGTGAGGARVYGKNNAIEYCYWEGLNGQSYESTLSIDGGDTTSPTNGHQAIVGGSFKNNLGVNCATAIVIGEHYSIAPSGITVRDNDFVNCGGVAIRTVKAPTGTNTFANNNHYPTLAEAGLGTSSSTGDQFAAQLYVSPTGNDSNPGTSASAPKRTLTAALAAASAGQTISAAPGVYNGNVITPKGGSLAAGDITLRSQVRHGAKINGDGGTSSEAAVEVNHPYVVIRGFEITGDEDAPAGPVRYGVQVNASNVDVIDNHIHHICQMLTEGTGFQGGAGVDTTSGPLSNVLITRNHIHDIGLPNSTQQLVHGIYLSGQATNCEVSNNLIYECEDFGIHPFPQADATAWRIVCNTVTACGRGILTGNNSIIRNNVSYNNGSSNYDTRGTGVTYSNNFSGGTGNVSGTGITGGVNPLFVNGALDGTGNFRPQATSPIINAGTATNAPAVDLDGIARPLGAAVDAGAFEGTAAPAGAGNTPNPAGEPYRKTGRGPLLTKLVRANVGPAGNRADGTGVSIGGAPGGGAGGGTANPAERVQAAQAIRDRIASGATIFEDWTWNGSPAIVGTHNDSLVDQFKAENPSPPYAFPADLNSGRVTAWLDGYIAANSPGGGGAGGAPAVSVAALLKISKAPGGLATNIGIGYEEGDPRPSGVASGRVHADTTFDQLIAGASIPGYMELTPDKLRVRLTAHSNGGTTPGSKYPRSEFRFLRPGTQVGTSSAPKEAFDPNKGNHYIIAAGRVTRTYVDKPEGVLIQYHDANDDVAMIRMRTSSIIEAKLGDTVLGNVKTGYVLNTDATWMIGIEEGTGSNAGKCRLTYWWDGVLKFATTYATRSIGWYGKGGAYGQSESYSSAPTESQARTFVIELSGLGSYHTGDPTPLGLKP